MKQYKYFFVSILLIFFSFLTGARIFSLDVMLDSEPARQTIVYFIKKFFLFKDILLDKSISAKDLMVCFTAFLFMVYIMNISLYGNTRRYRSLILLRYRSKKKFLCYHVKTVISKGCMIIVTAVASCFLAAWVNSISFYISKSDLSSMFILIINIFLFLILVGLINISCVIKYKDTTAMVITSVFTNILLLADVSESFFAIVTYGGIEQGIRGMALLISFNTIIYFITDRLLKKYDIL